MPHVIVKTAFGTIQFEYDDDDDLKRRLPEILKQAELVQEAVRALLPREPRTPKPGLAHIYQFTPSGTIELFHFPSTALATCILALYAYHPDMVSVGELEQATGISPIVSKVLGQTRNKKYFRKHGDMYGLSEAGLGYYKANVAPSLPSVPSNESEEAQDDS